MGNWNSAELEHEFRNIVVEFGWSFGTRKERDKWNSAMRRVWWWQIPSSCNIYEEYTHGKCLETELETILTTFWSGESTRTK
jgi:hypothetical protein